MQRIFTNSIIRKPCREMANGLTTARLGKQYGINKNKHAETGSAD